MYYTIAPCTTKRFLNNIPHMLHPLHYQQHHYTYDGAPGGDARPVSVLLARLGQFGGTNRPLPDRNASVLLQHHPRPSTRKHMHNCIRPDATHATHNTPFPFFLALFCAITFALLYDVCACVLQISFCSPCLESIFPTGDASQRTQCRTAVDEFVGTCNEHTYVYV